MLLGTANGFLQDYKRTRHLVTSIETLIKWQGQQVCLLLCDPIGRRRMPNLRWAVKVKTVCPSTELSW